MHWFNSSLFLLKFPLYSIDKNYEKVTNCYTSELRNSSSTATIFNILHATALIAAPKLDFEFRKTLENKSVLYTRHLSLNFTYVSQFNFVKFRRNANGRPRLDKAANTICHEWQTVMTELGIVLPNSPPPLVLRVALHIFCRRISSELTGAFPYRGGRACRKL